MSWHNSIFYYKLRTIDVKNPKLRTVSLNSKFTGSYKEKCNASNRSNLTIISIIPILVTGNEAVATPLQSWISLPRGKSSSISFAFANFARTYLQFSFVYCFFRAVGMTYISAGPSSLLRIGAK